MPSSTAFATSDTSARVGTGLWIIDSIICVAVIVDAVVAARHLQDVLLQAGQLRVADFDAEIAARDHDGVARVDDFLEARNRLAALDLRDDARVVARGTQQCTRFFDVRAPRARTTLPGSRRRVPRPGVMSSRSLSVSARADRPPPRRLMPLWSDSSPPVSTRHSTLAPRIATTFKLDLPVAQHQFVAGRDVLRQLDVGHPDAALGTVVRREVGIERERRAFRQHRAPVGEAFDADLGPLQVAEQRHVLADRRGRLRALARRAGRDRLARRGRN